MTLYPLLLKFLNRKTNTMLKMLSSKTHFFNSSYFIPFNDLSIIGCSNKSMKYEFTNQLFRKSIESKSHLGLKSDVMAKTNE